MIRVYSGLRGERFRPCSPFGSPASGAVGPRATECRPKLVQFVRRETRYTHRFSRLVSAPFRAGEGSWPGDRSRSISSLGAGSRLLPAADGRLQETAVVQTKNPAICGDYGHGRGVRPPLRPWRRTYRSSSEPTRIYKVDSRITKKRDSPNRAGGAHWATNPRLIEGAKDARTRS